MLDLDDRDHRLDRARLLLDQRPYRVRNGLLSLAALTGVLVSATLLITLLSGHEETTPVRQAGNSEASFEVSATLDETPIKQAVLVGTER